MTATIARSCGTCINSVPAVDGDGKINFQQRFCRAHPPQYATVIGPRGPQGMFLWPTMGSNDWCGEYQSEGAIEAPLPGENKPQKADA